jgi:uridylate kinase
MMLVVSVGGSIIVPEAVDYAFLLKFKRLITRLARKHKIVLVTGGGKTARRYIEALRKAGASVQAQDEVGIASTRLNALLLLKFFKLKQEMPKNLKDVLKLAKNRPITISGGFDWTGISRTSDGCAAEIAAALHVDLFVNMTNVAGLYDKDPQKHKDARLIRKISYANFNKIIAKVKERPGQHFILDKCAAKFISKYKIKTAIVYGRNLNNLKRCVQGKSFVGTLIS